MIMTRRVEMGCVHTKAAVVEPIFMPPDVMLNIERLCTHTEFVGRQDRFVMGIDTQFRISDFLEIHPSSCIQVAQMFLQLLAPALHERMLIVKAEANQNGLFDILLSGVKGDAEVRIFSRDFDDSYEPFVEVWFEKKRL